MKKRGQAATEFLTTYGWAILILALIIVILVTIGVFKPNVPSECKVDLPFNCEDFSFREGGFELTLNVDKISSGEVIDTSVLINNQPCSNVMVFGNPLGDLSLENGVNKVRCYGDINQIKEDGRVNAEVKINYISGDTNLEHTINAVMNGKVEDSTYMNNFDNSVVLSMDFDRDNGTSAIDDSYYSNHGVLLNGITNIDSDCASGKCYSFDGVDDYITTGFSNNLNTPNAISVEVWIKTFGTFNERAITEKGGLFRFKAQEQYYEAVWFTYNEVGNGRGFGAATNINDSKWHHAVATYDSNIPQGDPDQNQKIYVDGIKTNGDTNQWGLLAQNSNPVEIGRVQGVYYLDGIIDNVRIYNRALTPEEINDHYNELK